MKTALPPVASMPFPRWQGLLLACAALLPALPGQVLAQAGAAGVAPAAAAPAAAASDAAASAPDKAAPQQVQITGNSAPEGQDERRRSTASRISYGREEIHRMGDATLGEVLKRLPGVTLGGPPGRGGAVRMRGMGGGYTQILIDGQRMPPGFSLDSITPEQIERIEIMRAPVAEYGARAIAGTINVVLRGDFKRRAHELRIAAGADGSQPQASAHWQHNGKTEALGYSLNGTLFRGGQRSAAAGRTRSQDAAGSTTLDQQTANQSTDWRSGLFVNGRLQFKLDGGSTLELQPFFNAVRTQSSGTATLVQAVDNPPPPYTAAVFNGPSSWQMGRLNGSWMGSLGDGGRLLLRFGSSLSSSRNSTERDESGGSAASSPGGVRQKRDQSRQRELSADLNGKYSQLLAERHSASAGWELQRSQRQDSSSSLVDGANPLADFGEVTDARISRIALYAQDEWDWSPAFSFYLGARWEAIHTASDAAQGAVRNRSAVLTPLAHLVWKLPDHPRDQLRLSLTRSYRSPDTQQLIGRPRLSAQPLTETNQPSAPDRIGNPALQPELAWGLELGLEHYLEAGGIVSANVFARRINNLIRNVRSLETVAWASVPRWVARPQNIGRADAAGLELEAKARAADLLPTELPISLRANATLMWSRVDQVPGPNNRLEGQPPWTANLGADWPLRGTPLTLGATLNHTPGFELQLVDSQSQRQGAKSVLDAYALWRFGPEASARLSVSNAGARNYDSGSSTLLSDALGAPAGSQQADSSARSYTTVNLRAEIRF